MSSHEEKDSNIVEPTEEDVYLDETEIAESVPEDANEDAPMDDDDDEDDGEEQDDQDEGAMELADGAGHDLGVNADGNIELDMTNNSSAYFDKHEDSIFLIASHPTLPMVLTGGGDDVAYLWTTNSDSPKLVAKLDGQTESVIAGGFSYDGAFAVTGDMNGQLRVWQSAKRGQQWNFLTSVKEVDEIVWITFHPKQPIFALGASDGSVWVYSLEPSLNSISVLQGHNMACNSGTFYDVDNMDYLSLITIADDSVISWNAYTSTSNYTLRSTQLGGKEGWITNSLSPSGKTIAIGCQTGHLALINLANGNVLKLFDTTTSDNIEMEARSVEGIAWCQSMPILAVANVQGEIILYDVVSWNVRRTLKVADAVTSLKFLPASTNLISSDLAGTITRWDVRSGEQKFQGKGHYAGILGFALQNEGKRLITAGDEGVALVFKDE